MQKVLGCINHRSKEENNMYRYTAQELHAPIQRDFPEIEKEIDIL